MKNNILSVGTLIFMLLGNCFSNEEFSNVSLSSTPRDISGEISQGSTRSPVELCLTWWLLNKRFYKSCVIKSETDLLKGSGSDLMKCVNEIKDNILTYVKPTITVLKLQENDRCRPNGDMTAYVCMLVLKNGQIEGYAMKMAILSEQRYLVHIESDTFIAYGLDLYQSSGAITLTSLGIDNCDKIEVIRQVESFGVSTVLPGTNSGCIIQQIDGSLYGEYCLESSRVEDTLIKVTSNCSLSEYSLGVAPLLSKHNCDKVKLKAFCIVETIPHENHNDIIHTVCARPLLPFEEDNITNWKIKAGKDCLTQNPIDSVPGIQRGNYVDYKTIDINDEDIVTEQNMCEVYTGDRAYSVETMLFTYYTGWILPFFATSGIILNLFALKGAVQQTMRGSVKVYVITLALSNMALALNYIIFLCIYMTPLFSHIFCMIEPIIYRTFTNMSLLVMLGLSVERTIAVSKPLLIKSWCTASRARKVSYSV